MRKLNDNEQVLTALIVVLMLAVMILSCLLFVQLQELHRIKAELTENAPTELEEKLMQYLDGQIAYYEYNLNGLKAWDEAQK